MKLFLLIFVSQLFVLDVFSLIVPDEIPTILSVIYSNIPVLKKGTDSRLGWGFRLGDRADFQVLVELGPQTYTQPLANQEDKNTNKRNTIDNLSNTLYAQRQKDKQVSESEAGKWLQTWSKSVRQLDQNQELPDGAKPGLAIGEIDAKSVIPDDETLRQKELEKINEKLKMEAVAKLIQLLKENPAIREKLRGSTEKEDLEQSTVKLVDLTSQESESVTKSV